MHQTGEISHWLPQEQNMELYSKLLNRSYFNSAGYHKGPEKATVT